MAPVSANYCRFFGESDGRQGRVKLRSHNMTIPLLERSGLKCVCLQEEIETQRQQHEARVMSIRTEEKQKMDKMADDLDQKWRDALR